jgi:two-component system, sensor histidine kinase and response regulator
VLGRILVVDDNAMVRESYTELLRHRGYDVMQAGDGEEALKVIRTRAVDLAIIDVMMPVMGGLELRQVLQDKAPGIATILVTGQADKVEDLVDDDPDFQTGRVAMLYKPVHPVMLLAEVDKRLARAAGMR